MTVKNQIRWGGLASMFAGLLMLVAPVLRGFGLAPLAGQWLVFAYVILLYFVFAAIYAAQTPRIGKIGLAGLVLAIIGLGFTEVIAFLILASFAGLPAAHDVQMFAWGRIPILHLAVLFNTVGGILLGVGTMRAGVLPRWAGALLAVGALANLVHEYFLPLPALMIVPAIFFAAAFMGMGWAMWAGRPVPAMRPHLATGV